MLLILRVLRLKFFAQDRNSAAALMPARPMAALIREPDRQCAHHHDECRQSQDDNRCFAHCSLSDSLMPARDHRSQFRHSAPASPLVFSPDVPARDIAWRSRAADESRRAPQTAGSTDTLPTSNQRRPVSTASNSCPQFFASRHLLPAAHSTTSTTQATAYAAAAAPPTGSVMSENHAIIPML